jgi:YD repeat-containing protein
MRIVVSLLLVVIIAGSACQKELSAPDQTRNPDSTAARWRVKQFKQRSFDIMLNSYIDSNVYVATYDNNNRVIRLYDSVYRSTQTYSYNSDGKLSEVSHSSGDNIKFYYDVSGRLERRLVTKYGYTALPSYYTYAATANGTTVTLADSFRVGGPFDFFNSVKKNSI